jgi:hypothetical protein
VFGFVCVCLSGVEWNLEGGGRGEGGYVNGGNCFYVRVYTAIESSNADPDPACNLNADPDPGSQTNADPDLVPGQTYVTASEFLNEKYTYLILVILIDHKTYLRKY